MRISDWSSDVCSSDLLHTDGGGVSDIVFAVMHLLGLNFEPRIPRLSDRRLYAFEPRARYGKLAPMFGHRLDGNLNRAHWDDLGPMVEAMTNSVAKPSLSPNMGNAAGRDRGLRYVKV